MDKNVKVLRGTIEKLLPYREYTYNKNNGVVTGTWIDDNGVVNFEQIKVSEKMRTYFKTHYSDEILAGYILGYHRAYSYMNDK